MTLLIAALALAELCLVIATIRTLLSGRDAGGSE